MRVIPRTHRQKFEQKETFGADNLLSRGQEAAVEEDGREAVMMTLNPGQFSLHNTRLVHGSDPNPSDDRQIGFVARFIPTHVRQVSGMPERALLVRGEDTYHHFELVRAPMGDLTLGAGRIIGRLRSGARRRSFRKTKKRPSCLRLGAGPNTQKALSQGYGKAPILPM